MNKYMHDSLQMDKLSSRWERGSQKPAVMNLRTPRQTQPPPQPFHNATHHIQRPHQLLPGLQEPMGPASKASLGGLPRGPQRPPHLPFNSAGMSLFARPVTAC